MNASGILLGVALLAGSGGSYYFHSRFDAQRERADTEAALRQSQDQRIKSLEATRARLQQQLQALENGRELSAAAAESTPPAAPGATVASLAPGSAAERTKVNLTEGLQKKLNDPAFKRRLQEQGMKMGLRMTHKDVGKELDLSAEDTGKLMDLLARHQTEDLQLMEDLGPNATPEARRQAREQAERRQESELMSLLGHKYPQYQDYQRSTLDRMQVQQINSQLAAANLPMSDKQKQQMKSVLAEERTAKKQPTWVADNTPQENMARQKQWQQDYDKRVRSRASSFLSAEQLKEYDQMQQEKAAMSDMVMSAMPLELPEGATVVVDSVTVSGD